VEEIEEKYAEFKRQQKKIFLFLGLLNLNTIMQKFKANFLKHKELTLIKERKNWLVTRM
jgi:hypothetical protein